MKILAILPLVLLPVLIPPGHAQSLKNGNFSEASVAPELPDDWVIWGKWIRREPSWYPQPASGVALGYHHYQIKNEDESGFYQDVEEIKAGQKVRFTISAMLDKHSEGTFRPQSIRLTLESGPEGKRAPFATSEILMEEFPTDQIWEELSIEGTLPQDGLRVMVSVVPSAMQPRSSSIKFGEAYLEIQN